MSSGVNHVVPDLAKPPAMSARKHSGSPVDSISKSCHADHTDPKSYLPNMHAHEKFNPVKLAAEASRSFLNSHSGLSHFAHVSLQGLDRPAVGPTCNVQNDGNHSMWPVPPPRWRWSGSTHLGAKRRRRRRFHAAKHRLVQLCIIALNWECLGHPIWPVPHACLGSPISQAQFEIIERVDGMVSHYLHGSPFDFSELGRAGEKFHDVCCMIRELPHCTVRVEDLEFMIESIQTDFASYTRHFARGTSRQSHEEEPDPTHTCTDGAEVRTELCGSRPVQAERVKWNYPPSFDPSHFLSNPLVKAVFHDPEALRLPETRWENFRPAKVHCDKQELLRLAARWDNLGACTVLPAADKNFDEAVGLFCVPKDSEFDRLIINPKVINGRTGSISDFTRNLAPGAMIALLDLEPEQVMRFSADDLTDFYYTFQVSEARAARNAIRCKFTGRELQHLQCFPEDGNLDDQYLIALRTLAMGDNMAVEIAQQAHFNILRMLCGSMLSHESLRYRHPCPRSDFVELLAIDDHVGLQKVSVNELKSKTPKRDTIVFKAAEKAYRDVGLIQHPKKRKRNLTQGTILGADFDGEAGRVMGPRSRIQLLALISITVARIGTCTPKLLSTITGCWVHVLLFRRVLFAVMDAVFKDGQGIPQGQVFCLSRQSRNELQILGLLGPLAQADLRTKYSSRLFTTDASPDGAAVVCAQIGSKATRELWRHSEQRGFHTRLLSPASAYLVEKGFDSAVADSTFIPSDQPQIDIFAQVPTSLKEGIIFECVEIFRGSGNWSKAHERLGFSVHDGFDTDGSRLRVNDLMSDAVVHELLALAARGVVREWHSGMPCPSFGTLRRPPVRSNKVPFGFNPEDPYTKYHNKLAHRNAFILTMAVIMGQYISVEQPGGSRLFRLHCYKVLLQLGCVITHFDFCAFGSAFQKHSKWLHNKPWVVGLERRCQCKGEHFVIQGNFTKQSVVEFDSACTPDSLTVFGRAPVPGERVSSFSGAYPVSLMEQMASGSYSAKSGCASSIALEVRQRSFREVELSAETLWLDVPHEPEFALRDWWEDPEWVTELCESLHFKELYRFRFKRPGHINVNESRTYKSWLKSMAKSEPDSRFVGLLDSRVTIGAASKGRSSSFSLSRVLQGCICYVIGSGLYPGCIHCGSKHNRADEPSRGRPVRGPTKAKPKWLEELEDGNFAHFDCVHSASRYQKNPARWLRFLLLLAGDIEPNPGPVAPRAPRGPLDLHIGFAASTASRMAKCLEAFTVWAVNEFENWDKICQNAEAICWALRAYGMHCFSTGLPRYMFVYAVTAVQDRMPSSRSHMSVAWQVDRKWQAHEPGQCRAVLPASAVRAAVCLGFLWGWGAWAGVVLLAFCAMLHPSEMVALLRSDLIFPRDLDHEMQCLFLHIQNPKTSRFARRQHGRIDDPFVIWVAEQLFFDLPLNQKLFPGTISQFRRLWNAVMKRLGIPYLQSKRGATPGVLRGSGATYLYALSEDVAWIAWRGRWARTRTLEFYLQEVAAQLLLHQLDPLAREKIRFFDAKAFAVLCSFFTCGAGTKEWKDINA